MKSSDELQFLAHLLVEPTSSLEKCTSRKLLPISRLKKINNGDIYHKHSLTLSHIHTHARTHARTHAPSLTHSLTHQLARSEETRMPRPLSTSCGLISSVRLSVYNE
jgi:hypothetical protein